MINSTSQQQQQPHLVSTSTPTKVAKIKNKEKKRRKKKKRPPHKSKMITGYIIYASEIRKDVIKKYPDRDFGDISKLVGIEWKNLPQETKVAYEKRAQEQNAKSKAIAAEAEVELKKLADAAEERAKEVGLLNSNLSPHQQLPTTTCNGFIANGHSQPMMNSHHQQQIGSPALVLPQSPIQLQYNTNGCQFQQNQILSPANNLKPNNNIMQQQPLQIIQQQQQIATTVQYCGSSSSSNNNNNSTPNYSQQLTYDQTQLPNQQQLLPQFQYQRNNIVYRKPTTVRLRPKDMSTQTDPIVWVTNNDIVPKKPLRFSQKFIDYLNSNHSSIV